MTTCVACVSLCWQTRQKTLAEELGILEENEKIAYRATYIIDNDGIVRWVNVNDLSVGRNVEEVLRVLDALQTDELCPCNWKIQC